MTALEAMVVAFDALADVIAIVVGAGLVCGWFALLMWLATL